MLDSASTTTSYRTLCNLATGGMGQVDLAIRREGAFERLFAVKRLKPEYLSEADVRGMFLDEARIAGLVRHPNVVSVVDVGEDGSGPFLVMEFVEGISAAQLIASPSARPLPLEVALGICKQAADGLHAAHELVGPDGKPLELVHRDVSPQNILIGFDGIARVTDFGIAKALGQTSKTSTGVLKGKLGYLAPEQLRFEEPDRRADLFALGVVLFELLTGARLYKSKQGHDGPRRILTEPPPDLADYRDDAEPELVELLFRMLAKDRNARPGDARVVSRELEAMLARLVTSGETVQTSDFICRHFEKERAKLQDRVSEAREERERTLIEPVTPPRSSRLWIALAGLGLIAGAGAVFAATRAESEALPDRAPVVSATAEPVPLPAPTPVSVADAEAPAAKEEPQKPARAIRRPPKKESSKSGVPMWENY